MRSLPIVPRPTRFLLILLPMALALAACGTAPVVAPTGPAKPVEPSVTYGQIDVSSRAPADADGYRPPNKVGVLLPLSGPLATASQPVRDGLLAGYYAEKRRRPLLEFYDTSGGAAAAYQRAVAEGVDYVVGPLGREGVAEVFASKSLKVPMLALNNAETRTPAGNVSFALTPEDEAVSIAEALLASGARKAVVITGSDNTQRRAGTAFITKYNQRGGTTAASIIFSGTGENFANDLAAALQTSGGADAVFFALKSDQAKAVLPLLAASPAANAKRFATSQILSGIGKGDDSALDGIVFPTEAWNVRKTPIVPSASAASSLSASARGPAAKLFAFGYDAWLITAYPERLNNARDGGLQGATGDLRIDAEGSILRVPGWSVFRQGQPSPLAER